MRDPELHLRGAAQTDLCFHQLSRVRVLSVLIFYTFTAVESTHGQCTDVVGNDKGTFCNALLEDLDYGYSQCFNTSLVIGGLCPETCCEVLTTASPTTPAPTIIPTVPPTIAPSIPPPTVPPAIAPSLPPSAPPSSMSPSAIPSATPTSTAPTSTTPTFTTPTLSPTVLPSQAPSELPQSSPSVRASAPPVTLATVSPTLQSTPTHVTAKTTIHTTTSVDLNSPSTITTMGIEASSITQDSGNLITGVIVGVVVAILVIATSVFMIARRRKLNRLQRSSHSTPAFISNPIANTYQPRRVSSRVGKTLVNFVDGARDESSGNSTNRDSFMEYETIDLPGDTPLPNADAGKFTGYQLTEDRYYDMSNPNNVVPPTAAIDTGAYVIPHYDLEAEGETFGFSSEDEAEDGVYASPPAPSDDVHYEYDTPDDEQYATLSENGTSFVKPVYKLHNGPQRDDAEYGSVEFVRPNSRESDQTYNTQASEHGAFVDGQFQSQYTAAGVDEGSYSTNTDMSTRGFAHSNSTRASHVPNKQPTGHDYASRASVRGQNKQPIGHDYASRTGARGNKQPMGHDYASLSDSIVFIPS